MSFFFGQPQSTLGQTSAKGAATLEDIFAASIEQMRMVDNSNAAETALTQAYDRRIAAIEAATGQRLTNPMSAIDQPQGNWAFAPLPLMVTDWMSGQRQQRLDAFEGELAGLAEQFPDALDAIAPERPVREDALAIARESDERLGALLESREGWDGFAAMIGGGFVGAMHDPVTQGSLMAGAGPSAAKTAIGRILAISAREAAINAGFEAAMQPSVQGWRAEAGLESGLGQALANVGMAAALGGVFGAGLAGAGEGVGALLRRRLNPAQRDAVAAELVGNPSVSPDLRAGMAGDGAAAARALEPIRDGLPPVARGAMDAAEIDSAVIAPARANLDDTVSDQIRSAAPDAPDAVATFTTSRGSTYALHQDGTTTRNKAARADAGHEGDSGLKDRSELTVFVDSDASVLSAAGLSNLGERGARVVLRDGKASLLSWNDEQGRWGAMPDGRDIPVHTEPAAGRYPLELWGAKDDVPGYSAFSRMHAGNAITEVASRTAVDAKLHDGLQAGVRAANGDTAALDDLAARDPDLAGRDGQNPAYPRTDEDIPGPPGVDDPFDEAAMARAADELAVDEAMLDMAVPNENGDMVSLRELLADAEHDAALSRFVELCQV